jgi:hypothetical protein
MQLSRGQVKSRSALVVALLLTVAALWLLGSSANGAFRGMVDAQSQVAQAGDVEIVGALVNPGFEGTFQPQDGQSTVIVAPGWTARWADGRMGKPGIGMRGGAAENTDWRKPEWKKAVAAEFPYRVCSGAAAQQWFSFSGIHYAAVYAPAKVTPGDWVYFSVYGQGWSGQSDAPLTGGDLYASLGIDVNCGTDLESRSIVWTGWQWLPPAKSKATSSDNWTQFRSRMVQAEKSCITVWMATTAKWPTMHNDVYFDDVKVWKMAQGSECAPTPQPCPTCPAGGCDCPSAAAIREIIQTVVADREPVRWPR